MGATADVIVIGRGLMGTACARHLAEAGQTVILVGPDEPALAADHQGPFGSFHDAGRITRHLAHDADWARLSARSIARYDALEAAIDAPIFTACGGMMAGPVAGPGSDFTHAFLEVAKQLALPHERHDDQSLPTRFPVFQFPTGFRAAWEADGGVINPRLLRRAEEALALTAGAKCHRHAVTALAGREVRFADGSRMSAGHVVVATGGYAAADRLLPAVPKMTVYARTIAFAEVDAAEAARLADMPSLIWIPEGQAHDLYLLPPIRYPDGKLYLKIGGEAESPRLTNTAEMTAWFQSSGTPEVAAQLLAALRRLMPDLRITGTHSGSCAVSFTDTGYPYIARLSDDLTLLTGGNGAGAKCCDELGRLGARTALGQSLAGEGYDTDFRAVLA